MKYVLNLAKKKLLAKENRTFLAIFSIALIFSIQIFTYGIITSMKNYFEASYPLQTTSYIYVINGTDLKSSLIYYKNFTYEQNNSQIIIPVLVLNGKYNSTSIEIRATDNSFFKIFGTTITGKNELIDNNIIIGSIISKLFNLTIGKNISIDLNGKKENFNIIGIINSQTSFDYSLIVSLDFIWKNFGNYTNKISYFLIFPNRNTDIINLENNMKKIFGDNINFIYSNKYEIINKIFQSPLYSLNLWSAFLNIAAFLLAFMISLNNIRRMKNYFGILLSLGIKKKALYFLIFIENLVIICIGYLFGLSLGVIASSALIKGVSGYVLAPITFNPDYPTLFILSSTIALGFLLGTGISIIFFRREIRHILG